MSELKTNLQSILQEKNTKIIPQNIKKDVEVLDVTGNYDKEDIHELEAELADAQNELATVRRDLDNSTATISGNGEIITLNGTANARFKKAPLPLGNSTQETVTAIAGDTASGESINASGIDLNKVEILNINGNTKQETTTGKNLLNIYDIETKTEHGINFKVTDQVVTLNGTSDAGVNIQLCNLNYVLEANQPYTAVTITEGTSNGGNNVSILIGDSASSNLLSIFANPESSSGTGIYLRTYIFNENKTLTRFNAYVGGAGVQVNLKVKVMLLKGEYTLSTLPDYEKYTGGIASPNPDYPQEAYSAGANMNLFDKDDSNFNASWDGGDANKLTLLANGNIQTTADYNIWRAKAIDISSLKPNTQYTLSIELISATSTQTNLAAIRVPYNNGTSNSYINFNGNDSIYVFTSLTKPVFTFTTPSDMTYVGLSLSSYGASTAAVFGNIKIEEGNKATAYSEYNQGNMNVEISNKNLFGLTANDFINGTTTGEGKRVELYLKPNTNYTLSSNEAEGTDSSTNIWFNGTSSAYNGVGLNRPKTTRTDANGMLYISIRITKINTIFENYWIQLEEGSTATDHVVHEGQNLTIPTQTPFRKIGDYKDTFVKKVDGKWYEKHIIGEVIFDGSEDENWQQDNNDTYITVNDAKGTGAIPVISNYFTYTGNASGNSWGQIRFGMSNNNLIFFGNLILSDFKAWLSAHNTIVNYVLAEPIYIECTQEQSDILDQINTFYETTNIYSLDEISPNFDFTYNKVYASPSPDDESPIQNVTSTNLLMTSLAIIKSLNTTGTWNDNVYSNAGVTVTVKEDLSLEINGTSASHQTFLLASNNTLNKGTYSLSQIISTEEKARIYVWDSDWESIISTESLTKFTLNKNISANIGVNIFNSKTFDHFIVKPMISKNIEKYTPCNYINISVENKNLAWTGWAQDFVDRVNNESRASIETKDNRNCLKQAATAGWKDYDNKYIFKTNFKENTQYTLIFDLLADRSTRGNIGIEHTDGTTVEPSTFTLNVWNKVVLTSSPNKTIKYIRSVYREGTEWIDLDTFMVLEGVYTTQTTPSYIPHTEQEFIFPLASGQKLMLGDYLADDGIHHVRGQVKLDGSENIKWSINNYTTHYNFYAQVVRNCKAKQLILCDHSSSNSFSDTLNNCYISVAKNFNFNFSIDGVTTSNTFNDWLSTHNTTVEYELEEEVIVPYTSTQQLVYNNIKKALSYDEQTNVSGISSGASPRFDIVALRNMNDTLNTLENEIELLP